MDGTATSSFVSWDSKVTTVNAVLGGVSKFVAKKMKSDGLYEEFISIVQVRYADDSIYPPIPRVPFIQAVLALYSLSNHGFDHSESTAPSSPPSKERTSTSASQVSPSPTRD